MRFRNDNLVAKSINYKDLREVFNHNENKIKEAIFAISNDSLKVRLGVEAREYWAKILHTDPLLVHYGDIDDTNSLLYPNDELPYEYVIGNIDLNDSLDMKKLKGVLGSLHSRKSKNFENLELVKDIIILDPYNNFQYVNLPKLKRCKELILSGCKILNLAIEEATCVDLQDTTLMGKFKIKKTTLLNISNSNITDISSLESTWSLKAYNMDCEKLILNPNLKISSKFECDNSNFKKLVMDEHHI